MFRVTMVTGVDKIDLLVNNAGLATIGRKETKDGFEMMMGVNHLGEAG